MAGQLIRMKLRIMWNTVRSQTAVLIFSIIGILYGLGFTGFAYFGIAKIATMTIQAPWVFVMLPGPVIFMGWIICPVIMASMDNSLEPRRLSPFVAPTHQLARALIAASCVTLHHSSRLVLSLPRAMGPGCRITPRWGIHTSDRNRLGKGHHDLGWKPDSKRFDAKELSGLHRDHGVHFCLRTDGDLVPTHCRAFLI